MDLAQIIDHTKPIAQQASDLLMDYYRQPEELQVASKGKGEGDVTSADLAANDLILQKLQATFGTQEFAYITEETSEETSDDRQRLDREWVWIIDPLDGTQGFIEGNGEFAIHIGLVHNQRPVLGIVAMPVLNQIYWAIVGRGAYLDQDGTTERISVSCTSQLDQMTAIISRSHRSAPMGYLLDRLPKQAETNIGGLGGKWIAIATGKADYYITIPVGSAPKDWDFCAPEIILLEAGGSVSHFDGSALKYNQKDLCQTEAIVASNGRAHSELAQLCADYWQDYQNSL